MSAGEWMLSSARLSMGCCCLRLAEAGLKPVALVTRCSCTVAAGSMAVGSSAVGLSVAGSIAVG